jgi:hypothetical protein
MLKSAVLVLLFCWFSTISLKAQVIVFSENFQTGMPSNFTIVDNDGNMPAFNVQEFTSAWITTLDPENGLDTIAASTSFFSPQDTANRWLITPPISTGAFGNYFSWEAKSHDASYPDDYLVLISNTNNQIESFTDTIGFVIQENFEWTYREVDLSEQGYDNQTVYIAFVNVTYDGFKLYIDDLEMRSEDVTGVFDVNKSDFVLYPNPANDIITISSDLDIESIEILTSAGQIVLSSNTKSVDVNNLTPGIYYARVSSSEAISVIKFIKK